MGECPVRPRATTVIVSRLRSSATPFGSINRFALSFRDVEDLLAQRSITVTYETIRQGCLTFGPSYARTLRRRRGRLGDTWHLDELFVTLNGRRQYLWRAGLSLIKLTVSIIPLPAEVAR